MKILSSLLDKYKNFIPVDQEVKGVVVEWARTKGIKLDVKDVSLSHGTLRISLDPLQKTALFMHKKELLSLLSQKLGPKAPKEVC